MGSSELRDIFRKISNNDKVSDAAVKIGVDEVSLYGIIEALQLEGYNISLYNKDDDVYIYKKIVYRKSKNIKESLGDLEKISYGVIGDTHLGHKRQQLQLLNKFILEAYERGYYDFYHTGDITDGYYVSKREEHQYECFIRGYDEVLDYVICMWPELKGVNYSLISGNHDFTFFREIGADICKAIARGRDDIHYLGMDKATVYIGKNKNIPIKLMHPDKGATDVTSTRIQKSIEKLDTKDNPKAVFQGHFHRYYRMLDRNMVGFMVPCFLSGSIFIDRCELPNQIGGLLIDMYVSKEGEVQYLEYEPILYGEKDIDLESYKKVKKLVVK